MVGRLPTPLHGATDPTNYSLHTVVCVTREGSKRKKSLSLSLQSHRKGLCSDASSRVEGTLQYFNCTRDVLLDRVLENRRKRNVVFPPDPRRQPTPTRSRTRDARCVAAPGGLKSERILRDHNIAGNRAHEHPTATGPTTVHTMTVADSLEPRLSSPSVGLGCRKRRKHRPPPQP